MWSLKAGSVLLGRDAAEASDQGVRRGRPAVPGGGGAPMRLRAMRCYFPIDDSIDYEQSLTWDADL